MDAQVGVVGTGTMGSMTLWQLARAGVSTIGFEQYGIGHDRAAAGGESRIFRTAYLEGPEYVPYLQQAQGLWRELEAESGQHLLLLNGGLMIGPEDGDAMRNVRASVERFDLPHEILDRDAMAARYPQHRLDPTDSAVLDLQAGVLRPELAVVAAARCAVANGATIETGARVQEIESGRDEVRLWAGDREYTFEQVVVTAGPWTGRFAPALERFVTPRELVMTWYPAVDVAAYLPDRFPVFIRESDHIQAFGIPALDGASVKVAPHVSYWPLDSADDLDRNIDPASLGAIDAMVAAGLPGLLPSPVRVSAYMDAYTDDGHGLVGAIPGTNNVWVLGGFSGHGFKMAPTFGRMAADLVQHGRTDLPTEHLAPERFLG